jgi:hypothetical protein
MGSNKPPVFGDAAFDAAMERTSSSGLWLVVSATGSDAAGAAMDDVTWRHPGVTAWIERNGLAVRVDIDAQPHVARELDVRAVPTTIVFRAGRHEERTVGFQDGAAMSAWLASLEAREKRPDEFLRESSIELALKDGRYDEATRGYVWLWNNIPDFPGAYQMGWMGMRGSVLLRELATLTSQHAPAHADFSAIRDASAVAAPTFDRTDWFGPRVDWLNLNQVLAERDRTLTWFDGVKADPRYAPVIQHCARLLKEPLQESQRWADLGRLFPDALAKLAEVYELANAGAPASGEREGDEMARLCAEEFRNEAAVLYAGLRAAGRANDAKAVREEALRLDPSAEMKRALEQAPASYN